MLPAHRGQNQHPLTRNPRAAEVFPGQIKFGIAPQGGTFFSHFRWQQMMNRYPKVAWARLALVGTTLVVATASTLHVAPATAALKRVIIVQRMGDVATPSLIDTYQEGRLKLAPLQDVPTKGGSSNDFGE